MRNNHRKRRALVYNGYRIVLVRTRWGFPYEWVIEVPLNKQRILPRTKVRPKRLASYTHTFYDPTSHRTARQALYFAKCKVNEIRSPRFLRGWDERTTQ